MRIINFIAASVLLLGISVLGGNWAALDRKVSQALAEDHRNNDIRMAAYLAGGINLSTLVLDLRSVGGQHSMADVDRVLLTSLRALKAYSFEKVVLAYQFDHKFQFTGAYAKALGEEYGAQNVVYTMRTMQENLYKPDGSRAFGTWTGGMLGVLNKQMEDHRKFHEGWYLASLSK